MTPLSITTAIAEATPQRRAPTIRSRMPALMSSQICCAVLPAMIAAMMPIARKRPPIASKPRFIERMR